MLSAAGLAGLGSWTKAFAAKPADFSKAVAPPVSVLQDGIKSEENLEVKVDHEHYLHYQSRIDHFMQNVFPSLPKADKEGAVAEFGSYRGFVTNKLISFYKSKVTGFEIHKYIDHPQIHYTDFVKNPSCLKPEPLVLGWNGFRRWSSHPSYRAQAFSMIVSRLVAGGLYIDDMAHEFHPENVEPYGLRLLYKDGFIGCFQKA